jgi:hypothetical protein
MHDPEPADVRSGGAIAPSVCDTRSRGNASRCRRLTNSRARSLSGHGSASAATHSQRLNIDLQLMMPLQALINPKIAALW